MKTYDILYLGLKAPQALPGQRIIHFPIIQIVPFPPEVILPDFQEIERSYTHFIFTSQSSVEILCRYLPLCGKQVSLLENRFCIAVGKSTAKALEDMKIVPQVIAKVETAEGIVAELDALNLKDATIFWPRSKRARPVLLEYFQRHKLRFKDCVLYDTQFQLPGPLPDLDQIDEIHFTSPSTIDAYLHFFGTLPKKKFSTIGPITEAHLQKRLSETL